MTNPNHSPLAVQRMNEQRTQAYLNLIHQLLSGNEGDEPRILQEKGELVDQDLIEVMIAVARQYI